MYGSMNVNVPDILAANSLNTLNIAAEGIETESTGVFSESVYQTVSNASRSIEGLTYQSIPGDGHCLYTAVNLYLGEGQEFLRHVVAAHLEHNLADFAQFIVLPHGKTLADYLKDVRNGVEWASHVEIEVLMRILNRPIIVIEANAKAINPHDAKRFTGEPIFVYYNGHHHYDAYLLQEGFNGRNILQSLLTSSLQADSDQSLMTQLNEYSLLSEIESQPVLQPMAHDLGESTNAQTSSCRKLPVKDIHFIQNSVARKFTNGTLVEDTINQLRAGTITIDQIPIIRVVEFQGRWVTLDHRRLRIFKEVGIEEIEVCIKSLDDPKIKNEFERKHSEKSIDQGGVIRDSRQPKPSSNAVFAYNKNILNWNIAQLQQTKVSQQNLLKDNYPNRDIYFHAFVFLIFEESRAILQQGIEHIEKNKPEAITINLKKAIKPKKSHAIPITMVFTVKPKEFQSDCAEMFLLKYRDLTLLAMAVNFRETLEKNELHLQVVLSADIKNQYSAALKNENAQWQIQNIGSLISQRRMYEVCVTKPMSALDNALYTGILQNISAETEIAANLEFSSLNSSQSLAVKAFLNLEQGIQLVQGPPGTGKTTTIIQLLKALISRQQRILISAPSNKALQILAEALLKACPDVPMLLMGVEKKLLNDKPELEKIFSSYWERERRKEIENLQEMLVALSDSFDATDPNYDEFLTQIEKLKCDFLQLVKNITSYQLPAFVNIWKMRVRFGAEFEKLATVSQRRSLVVDEHTNLGDILKNIETIIQKLSTKLHQTSEKQLDLVMFNNAAVVFATLSVCGRTSFRQPDLKPIDALIVDEAGQALETETLIPLWFKPKKCLLVGDTNQLPATVISPEAAKLKYGRSLLWRLLQDCRQDNFMLQTQYRMHTEISQWPSQYYYAGKLENNIQVCHEEYRLPTLPKDLPNFLGPYAFISIRGQEQEVDKSLCNPNEINAIDEILTIYHQQYQLDIVKHVSIITFYSSQVRMLEERFSQKFPGIKIKTVDGFQGGESDIVIISFVRANSSGKIGFLNDFRRLNVALTRARYNLVMVGDAATLASKNQDLKDLINDAKVRNKFFNYSVIRNYEFTTATTHTSQQNNFPFFRPTRNDHKRKLDLNSNNNAQNTPKRNRSGQSFISSNRRVISDGNSNLKISVRLRP